MSIQPEMTPKKSSAKHQPLELLVLVAFVVSWLFTKDAIFATMVLTAGTVIQLLIMLMLKMPITKMQKTMFAAILIGGGLTVLFRDPQFIKWKLTIVNSIFAITLLAMQILGKTPIKTMLESVTNGQDMKVSMPEKAWSQITYVFAGFFASVAIINAYITIFMDFNAWVMFRSILFVVSLVFLPGILMFFFIKYKALQQPSVESTSDVAKSSSHQENNTKE